MFKLVKLEWKKNRIGMYIRNACILTAILLLMAVGMAGELETREVRAVYGRGMISASVEMLTSLSYVVFTGVMLSSFIVNSYENRTIHLMFSYPIKRQKILLSKILAVWTFNFAALFLSKLLIYGFLLLAKPFLLITADSIQMKELSFWMEMLISSAVMVSISHIALLVGLKLRSSKAAIVTSVVIVCLTQGNIGVYTLADNIPFYVVLLILSVLSVYMSVYDAETKDVI